MFDLKLPHLLDSISGIFNATPSGVVAGVQWIVGALKLLLSFVIGVPLFAFALALKYAVLLGNAVYFKLHPLIAYAESLFPAINAPEWFIPSTLAIALALYSILQIVLPFYLNIRVPPRAEYLLYTLIIAPLVMVYLFNSIAGIAVWAITFLLSRVNIAFNFDRKLPTLQICGLAERYDCYFRR